MLRVSVAALLVAGLIASAASQGVVCKAKVDVAITVDSSTSISATGHQASVDWLARFPEFFDIRPDRTSMTLHQHTVANYGLKHWSVFDLVTKEKDYLQWIKDPSPKDTNAVTPDPNGRYCYLCGNGSGSANLCPCLPSTQAYDDENGTTLCTEDTAGTPIYCHGGVGHSCTGCGLNGVVSAFDKSNRKVAARIVIVISDFQPNGSPTLTEGRQALLDAYPDTTIIALGVGNNINGANANFTATAPNLVLNGGAEDAELLADTLEDIQSASCFCRDDCGGHGACFEDGTCLCDVGYQGETCTSTFVPALVAATAALAALAAGLLGLHRFWGSSAVLEEAEEEEEIYEEPEVMEDLIIEAPMMIEPSMDTDANAAGAPPATDNRPMFSPASRVQPNTFNRGWKAGGATFV